MICGGCLMFWSLNQMVGLYELYLELNKYSRAKSSKQHCHMLKKQLKNHYRISHDSFEIQA